MVLLLLLSAFEYPGLTGRSSAMLAGVAVADAQHSFCINPALVLVERRFTTGVSYARPYGLRGLSWGRACGGWSSERTAAGAGFTSLQLGHYAEQDAQIVVGGTPARTVAVGLGIHALMVSSAPNSRDVVPSFDAGACWRSGRVQIGAAGLRLNSPRWRDGTEVPLRVVLGGSWYPVDEVLLALDVSRERGEEDAAFGVEFRPISQLGLRLGVGAVPLRYAAGLGATVGPVGIEYAYQFHPTLKETHVLGLRAAWH